MNASSVQRGVVAQKKKKKKKKKTNKKYKKNITMLAPLTYYFHCTIIRDTLILISHTMQEGYGKHGIQ